MSQDRRKPTQLQEKQVAAEPGELLRLELVPFVPTQRPRTGHLTALLQLLSENGIDCSVLVDAADDETPRTLH